MATNQTGITTLTTATSTVKFYKVYAGTRKKKDPLDKLFNDLIVGRELPLNLSEVKIDLDNFQLRELNKSGKFWWGCFGRLRKDAPNVVNSATGAESTLKLGKDDKLLEKSYFFYSEQENVLLWHVNNAAGGVAIFKDYLRKVSSLYVRTEYILDPAQLSALLYGDVKEIIVDIADLSPQNMQLLGWNNAAMRLLQGTGAGSIKLELKAPAAGKLTKRLIRPLVEGIANSALPKKHLKIKSGLMTDPVDIFLNTLKDSISYNKAGHYPVAVSIIAQLKSCYLRNKGKV